MVDEMRLMRLLRGVTDDVSILRDRAAAGAEALLADRALLDSVKYVFITASEGAIRASQHVAAAESWEAPETNADAFCVLAAHGVIEEPLAERLAAAAGFRNLLIHQYGDIDDRRTVRNLGSLGDLDDFVDSVVRWVGGEAG